MDKASSPILSPCKYSKGNLEDNPAVSRDKTSVTEMNTAEINEKDGSRASDKKTARKTSLHLQSKSGGESAEDKRKLKLSGVKNITNDGDHGIIGLNKAKSSDVEEDEDKAIYNEDNERKLGERKTKNCSIGGDRGSEILDKAKSRDVEIYEGGVIDNEVTLPADGCGRKRGEDKVGRVTTRSAAGELLTSEQKKGKQKVPNAYLHSQSKDLNNNSRPEKKGKSKKSVKNLKSDCNVIEPINHSESEASKAEEHLWEKTKRKIDFDVKVTLDEEAKKQKTNTASTDSLGQKRSRSGRVLVASLEFWRNQIPVYDMDRNLIQVKEDRETNSTPSKRKSFGFSKAKKMNQLY